MTTHCRLMSIERYAFDRDTGEQPGRASSWEEAMMKLCTTFSRFRSRDPRTAVGAGITNNNNEILAIGYNGPPPGFNDNAVRWETRVPDDNTGETKYDLIIHAETNAIESALKRKAFNEPLIMYVSHYPCKDCAKRIVNNTGIYRVVFRYYASQPEEDIRFAEELFRKRGIQVHQHIPLYEASFQRSSLNTSRLYRRMVDSLMNKYRDSLCHDLIESAREYSEQSSMVNNLMERAHEEDG